MDHLLFRLDAASKVRSDDPERPKWPIQLCNDAKAEIERLRAALERVHCQASNACSDDGETALFADLEKIEKWSDVGTT